jgi:hypothetical protein
MSRIARHLLLVCLIGLTAATARGDQAYRIFDELVDKQWKDAEVQLNYYAIQLRNESIANALVVLHPARNARNPDVAWAWCIRRYLVNREHIAGRRLAFFVGEPEDKFTVRLWLAVYKAFPVGYAKDHALQPLTIGARVNGRRLCATLR